VCASSARLCAFDLVSCEFAANARSWMPAADNWRNSLWELARRELSSAWLQLPAGQDQREPQFALTLGSSKTHHDHKQLVRVYIDIGR